ncbi:sensor histidine kinase [Thermovibrio sp.]
MRRFGEKDTDLLSSLGSLFEELLLVDQKGNLIGREGKLWELFPSPEVVRGFRELFSQGETVFEFEEKGNFYVFKGRLVGKVGVLLREDITVKKKLNSLKKEVISTLSHELRTPLSVIRGNGELLLELGYDKEVVEEIVRKTCEIEEVLKSLKKLFDGSKGFPVVNLRPIALQVLGFFKRRAEEKGLRLSWELSDTAVAAEPLLFKQLLKNLLDNAVKFTDRGEVKVFLSKDFLKVEDTGRGIPEELRERVFEKYFKGEGGGQGIGLSVVKEIAKFHGWRLEVKSEEDKGTSFTVYFQ